MGFLEPHIVWQHLLMESTSLDFVYFIILFVKTRGSMDLSALEMTRMDSYPDSEVNVSRRWCLSNKSLLEARVIVGCLGPGHRGAGLGPGGQHLTRPLGLHREHEGDAATPVRAELVHHHLTLAGAGHVVILTVDRAIIGAVLATEVMSANQSSI